MDQAKKLKTGVGIQTHFHAKCYDNSNLKWHQKQWNRIVLWLGLDVKKYYFLGPMKWEDEKTNVIANVGFQVIGEILTGVYGDTGEIDFMALGDDNTAPTAGDTALGNEVYRNATFSGTVSGNITYLTAVYTETEVSGTFEEFGNFIDGSGAADSGELWSHVLTGGWVKTLTDVLIVDIKYTFSSS